MSDKVIPLFPNARKIGWTDEQLPRVLESSIRNTVELLHAAHESYRKAQQKLFFLDGQLRELKREMARLKASQVIEIEAYQRVLKDLEEVQSSYRQTVYWINFARHRIRTAKPLLIYKRENQAKELERIARGKRLKSMVGQKPRPLVLVRS